MTGWLRRKLTSRAKPKRCPLHHSTPRQYLMLMRYSTNILCTCRPIHVTAREAQP